MRTLKAIERQQVLQYLDIYVLERAQKQTLEFRYTNTMQLEVSVNVAGIKTQLGNLIISQRQRVQEIDTASFLHLF